MKRVTGVILILVGARAWWECWKYTSDQSLGWAMSISGVTTMIVGLYGAAGWSLDGEERA